jgi:hypothetical protein
MILFVSVAMVVASAAYAHHSASATYDTGHQVKLEGKLVQIMFKNPHTFVTLQAPDENGVMQRWAVEWSGTGQLTSQGVTAQTLKPGDEVVIVGNPSRVHGEYKALMVTVTRCDGFKWGGRGRAGRLGSRADRFLDHEGTYSSRRCIVTLAIRSRARMP